MKGAERQYEEPRIILEDNGIAFLETELRKKKKHSKRCCALETVSFKDTL